MRPERPWNAWPPGAAGVTELGLWFAGPEPLADLARLGAALAGTA